jgi:hypothetical protein
MSSDDRCPAVHPELGIRCERMTKHCVGPGIDHTAKRADGTHALWPNEHLDRNAINAQETLKGFA